MRMQFYDRYEAGEFLAEQLTVYANKPNVIVLALTSGGAAVAFKIARRLHLPLELLEEGAPDFSPPEIKGQTIILVDDGIARDQAMRAAIKDLRTAGARRIVVAAPVIAAAIYDRIREAADDVATLIVPEEPYAIGQFYGDFSEVTGSELRNILRHAARAPRDPAIAA